MYEIIYTCKSINNKNVRRGELKILRKNKELELCFEFGESELNLKKRFYNNEKDFESDFAALSKLKEQDEKEDTKEEATEEKMEESDENETIGLKDYKHKKTSYNKNSLF